MDTDSTLAERKGGESYLQMDVLLCWQQQKRHPLSLRRLRSVLVPGSVFWAAATLTSRRFLALLLQLPNQALSQPSLQGPDFMSTLPALPRSQLLKRPFCNLCSCPKQGNRLPCGSCKSESLTHFQKGKKSIRSQEISSHHLHLGPSLGLSLTRSWGCYNPETVEEFSQVPIPHTVVFFPFCRAVYEVSSVHHSVVSDSLRAHESQQARPPCPSPTPGVYPNPWPSSQWCHPAISSSVIPFSSCPQSFPAFLAN